MIPLVKAQDFYRRNVLCDTVIHIGDVKFEAHSVLLALKSPFFKKVFQAVGKEKEYAMVMNDVDPVVMGMFLEYIYTGELAVSQGSVENEIVLPPTFLKTFNKFGVTFEEVEEVPSSQNEVFNTNYSNIDAAIPSTALNPEPDLKNVKPQYDSNWNNFKEENTNFHYNTMGSSIPSAFEFNPGQCGLMCEACGHVVNNQDALDIHIFQEHSNHIYNLAGRSKKKAENGKIRCELCDEIYGSTSSLKHHVAMYHTTEFRYKCRFCDKGFVFNSQLISHVRTHTGEKPFKCHLCDKSFSAKLNLTQHIRIHTGEKPYRCNHCERTFSQRSHLQTHLRTHTGEKPFCCEYCEKSYKNRLDLRIHCKKIHDVDIRIRAPNSYSAHTTEDDFSSYQNTTSVF